jgi:hypothetical protein
MLQCSKEGALPVPELSANLERLRIVFARLAVLSFGPDFLERATVDAGP